MLLTNAKMDEMCDGLQKLLPHRDKVGYFAARNTRILNDNLTEYHKVKEDLIRKYGTDAEDGSVQLSIKDPKFEDFSKELEEFSKIEHDVTLMTMKYEDVVGLLSGEEILDNDWMFED